MDLINEIIARAKADRQRIVLPEGTEERTLKAADQVLADEDDDPVEDVDNVDGFESLKSFGEFEDDSVFVRNDRLKCDFEILLDQRNYSDVCKLKPHQRED